MCKLILSVRVPSKDNFNGSSVGLRHHGNAKLLVSEDALLLFLWHKSLGNCLLFPYLILNLSLYTGELYLATIIKGVVTIRVRNAALRMPG